MRSQISKTSTSKPSSQSEREKNLQVLRTIRDAADSSAKERMDAVAKLERIESGRDLDEDQTTGGRWILLRVLSTGEFNSFKSLLAKCTTRRARR